MLADPSRAAERAERGNANAHAHAHAHAKPCHTLAHTPRPMPHAAAVGRPVKGGRDARPLPTASHLIPANISRSASTSISPSREQVYGPIFTMGVFLGGSGLASAVLLGLLISDDNIEEVSERASERTPGSF